MASVVESYKHPLEHTWSLWYFKNEKNRSWEDNLKKMNSFNTAEDFWCLYNHIKKPSELTFGTDYNLFKKGIRPMWEDPANKEGGRWVICIEKKASQPHLCKTDEYWLNLSLLLIGENCGNFNDYICGLTVNVRPKMDKIGIWLNTVSESAKPEILSIGKIIRDDLQIPRDNVIYFQTRKEYESRTVLSQSMYRL